MRFLNLFTKKKKNIKDNDTSIRYKSLINTDLFYISDFYENTSFIKGMTTEESGINLFNLAFAQSIKGDIVEIGSWQGRSTSYLAQTIKLSNNGSLYAIDHFKGNPGKEDFYKAIKEDLSDLEDIFKLNLKKIGLENQVNLINKETSLALEELISKNVSIRLLFIDGCHDYLGVSYDYNNFSKLVLKDGIIILDDFSSAFPGVIKFIDEIIKKDNRIKYYYSYANTFVIHF